MSCNRKFISRSITNSGHSSLRLFIEAVTHWGQVTHIRQYNIWTLLQIMACRLFGTKPLHEPMLQYCQWHQGTYFSDFCLKFRRFHSRKCTSKCRLRNGAPFYLGLMYEVIQAYNHKKSLASVHLLISMVDCGIFRYKYAVQFMWSKW